VAADASDALLAHAAELVRRDAEVAGRLQSVRELADRAVSVRARAAGVEAALRSLPGELVELTRRRREADAREAQARRELASAEGRVAELEAGRRRRADEIDRARSELETARESYADAEAEVQRLDASEAALRSEQTSLDAEAAELVAAARSIAGDLKEVDGLAESALRTPGPTVEELDGWGAGVRSALFVVRGTLEAQRERVVAEANALGASVLGEELGASSVTVVHRRLAEQARRSGL
jgi:chromosome segregation ATPase